MSLMRPPAPGRLVAVGGTRLHVHEQGSGPPVLLEGGAREWSSHWGAVAAGLASSHRVLAYDRAGLGWSEPGRRPRTAAAMVAELEGLLDALAVGEPAVFVGHGAGAGLGRLLAARAPRRVAGLVMVDAWNEAMAAWERERGVSPATPRWRLQAELWAARVGLLRFALQISPVPAPPWPIPTPDWHAILTIGASPRFVGAALAELDAAARADAESFAVRQVAAPVRVLVAEAMLDPRDAPHGYPVGEHNRAWVDSARDLASLSEDTRLTVVTATDHMIQLRRPEVVVDAVTELTGRRDSGS